MIKTNPDLSTSEFDSGAERFASSTAIGDIQTSRRNLLKASVTSAGGLAISIALPGCSTFRDNQYQQDGSWSVNAWLEIMPDNKVIFTLDRVEMGQGTYTGLTTLIAEELHVEPGKIIVHFAGVANPYRNPDYGLQITGGSNSLSSSWQPLRIAAATAREMLLSAATNVFQVDQSELSIDDGLVKHVPSGKSVSYGELSKLASKERIPKDVKFKDRSEFRYIGKHNTRLDSPSKVTGKAVYGIDVVLPDMHYAVVSRAPVIGAELISFNDSEVMALPGVIDVVEIERGVAIVASSYWKARKASEVLKVEWAKPDNGPVSSASIRELYIKTADKEDGSTVLNIGDAEDVLSEPANILELEYEAPFLAHATMEPMNCVAKVADGKADIWTGTQGPDVARVAVAKVTDVALENVTIHNQFIGGGFGRRLCQDYVAEAAEISFKTGKTIKLVWSREEDTKHDLFRPATYHRLKAGFDEEQNLIAWSHQIVAPEIMDWYVWDASPAMFPWAPKFMYTTLGHAGLLTAGTPVTPADHSPYEGADTIAYDIPNIEVRHAKADAGVPITYWRSVGHSQNAFVIESFVNELAMHSSKDEFEFRKSLLGKAPRHLNVLEKVAKEAKWGNADNGVYQGLAVHQSFGSYAAQIVDLKVENNEIRLLKVVCAIDCGFVVNPDIVRMQIESGIIFGATAALYGEITIEDGQVQQSNFHDYPIMRMNEAPEIKVIIVDSKESPTGIGEPGVPPIAPAIASAVAKATGKKVRQLPIKLT